jgi:hypothetical protein
MLLLIENCCPRYIKMKEYLKGWKFWAERARGYALWVQAILIIDIWLRTSSFFSWPIVVAILTPITVIIMYLDYKFIYPGEAASSWKANPEWMALRQEVRELKELIESRYKNKDQPPGG